MHKKMLAEYLKNQAEIKQQQKMAEPFMK